jgi:glycosyltransferase 2 family protein
MTPLARYQAFLTGHGRVVIRLAAGVLTVLVVLALIGVIRRDGPAAWDAWRNANVQWVWITGACLLGLVGHLASIAGWHRLLKDSQSTASFDQAAKIFLVSNLGRYLPGAKAWQMGIVGMMAVEDRLSAGLLALTSLFYGLVGVGVGFLLLLLIGGALIGVNLAWLSLVVFGLVLLIAAPAVVRMFPRAWQFTSARFSALNTVTPWTMWALVWTAAASWIAWGLGLTFLARGLFVEPTVPVAAHLTAWIASFLGGLVAFVAPAGLGVRDELMRTTLVTAGLGAGPALVIMMVARVWATVLDVAPALGFLGVRLIRQHRPAGQKSRRGQISA